MNKMSEKFEAWARSRHLIGSTGLSPSGKKCLDAWTAALASVSAGQEKPVGTIINDVEILWLEQRPAAGSNIYTHPAPAAPQQCAELPELPEAIEVGGEGWDWEDFQNEKTFSVEHLLHYGAACAQAAFAEAARQVPAVAVIRQAILDYYDDLTARKHGGVAMDKAFNKIQDALGMCWQDEALIKRSATTQGDKQ